MMILVFAAGFSILNAIRAKELHVNLASTAATRNAAERQPAQGREPTSGKASLVIASDADAKAAKAEADLAQVLKEKADLQTKLQASQAEIASLQNRPAEPGHEVTGANPGAPSTAELQAQLDDARHQLDSAERENMFLSEKLGTPRERTAQIAQPERKRKEKSGVRGTVLAVNQAYNFVVLNLGGRQGIAANSEMLVFREGTLIGKIRISSVEPATAIGDIITNSLARGVQVQPGDTVIYASTHS
jgi:hypothetical protein